MHLDRQNAQLGTKHGVHCRLTMGLMISTTCLYSNFDLINHIYKKKRVFATSATNQSFVVLQQHYWPLRNYLVLPATKKDREQHQHILHSYAIETSLPSLNALRWSKASGLCCKSSRPGRRNTCEREDSQVSLKQCCHSVMKKNSRFYLEKKTDNNKRKQTYKMF